MAKVLISFVGTGALSKKMESEREYRTARYRLGNEDLGEYPFVAAALAKHHAIDKIILIGTVHSMWEEVYRYFSEANGLEVDEQKYLEISEYCNSANYKTQVDDRHQIPYKDDIEKAIGKATILLIKYGVNEKDIEENMAKVLSLKNELYPNDEVIVDVTHSFRSLPMLIMNLLIYLHNVRQPNINISHIYYGMLEISREMQAETGARYAPIIDLKNILLTSDWIIGAYAFSQYGNAYKIAELIGDDDRGLAERLSRFSDVMNLNHLDAIEKEANKFKGIKNKEYESMLTELIVKPVVNDFLKSFGAINDNHAKFQYRLAKWQFDHMNYAASLLTLQEAIITCKCQKEGCDWNDQKISDEAKDALYNSRNRDKLGKCFYDINWMRNSIAHARETRANAKAIIKKIEDVLAELKESF